MESFCAIETTAFTASGTSADRFLKLLFALKFNHGVRVNCDRDIRYSPILIAKQIANYINNHNQDMIILGKSSGLGDNGQVGYYLAELLNIPCVSNVLEIIADEEGRIIIKREVDDGILAEEASLPGIFIIGNAPISYLRVPTLKDKLAAKKKEVEVLEFINDNEEIISLEKLLPKISNREGLIIQGESLEEKIDILLNEYLDEKRKKI